MLVGRERELLLLQTLTKDVASGRGAAVWLTGESGIGKSTLISAGLAEAEHDGCRVYSAILHEQSGMFPLHCLIDAFGRRSSVETRTVDEARRRLAELVRQSIMESPTVLVVDDAQWADTSSLAVLSRLALAVEQVPLLLVVAARSVPQRAEVDALRRTLVAGGAAAIELGPLADDDVALMAARQLGQAPGPMLRRLLDAAGGNPRYVRALVEAVELEPGIQRRDGVADTSVQLAGLPATLASAMCRRLQFLAGPTIAVLRIAAVLGRSFASAELATITGKSVAELTASIREAADAGVLVEPEPGLLAFGQPLIHQSLYQSMPMSLRAAMHHQAAEQLAQAAAPPERVAEHLMVAPRAAGVWEIDWLAQAGRTLAQMSPRVAVGLLERRLGRLNATDLRHDGAVADLAAAKLMLGDDDAVVRMCPAVLASTGDPELAGRVGLTLAHALSRLGRNDDAVDVITRALSNEAVPPAWRARLMARQARSLLAIGHRDTARAVAERAEQEGHRAGDRFAVGLARYTLALLEIHHCGRTQAGIELIEKTLASLGDDPECTDLRSLLRASLGAAKASVGDWSAADQIFAELAPMTDRCTPPGQAEVLVRIAAYAFSRGRWDDALSHIAAAERLPLDPPSRRYAAGVLAQIALHRDDRDTLERCLAGADDREPGDSDMRDAGELLCVAGARRAERDRDPREALARLLAIEDPAGTLAFASGGLGWLTDVVRLALALDDAVVATAAARASARRASGQGTPGARATARHCHGLLHADPSAVLDAADTYRNVGDPLSAAVAYEDAAAVQAERGDRGRARTAFLEAIESYRQLDATWDIRRTDARLRPYGIRRGARGSRPASAAGWGALTPAEHKVAEMVAAGRSNPDIAAMLLLSRHTVESHVSRILRKLDASSRTEILRPVALRE